MKKSVVIKAKRIHPITSFNLDYKSLVFFIIFVCGLILGITIIKNSDEGISNLICGLLKRYLITLKNSSFLNIFSGTFLSLFIGLFYIYLFGLCCIGTPFIGIAPLIWGVFSGIIVSSFYSLFGFSGLGYCCIINIPCYATTAATIIRGCCIGANMSNEIFLSLISSELKKQPENIIKNYSIKFIVLIVFLVLATLMKTGSYELFGDLFVLV